MVTFCTNKHEFECLMRKFHFFCLSELSGNLSNRTAKEDNIMSYTAAEFTKKYDTYFICTSIIAAVLTPVAVVGNALVLTAILRNPPTNILLATMAFTDFGTGIITQPFYVVLNFRTEKDDFKLIDMTT